MKIKILIICFLSAISSVNAEASLSERTLIDTNKPNILFRGAKIQDNMQVPVQINAVFIDSVYAEDLEDGRINCIKTAGFNGNVMVSKRGIYPIQYSAVDAANNAAVENNFRINYKIDDFIQPTINLNSPDTICHQVNKPYTSIPITATDNYYNAASLGIIKVGSVDPYKLGLYLERFEVTDGSGNIATKIRFVKVEENCAQSNINSTEKEKFSVYPNPCTGNLYISFNNAFGAEIDLQIISITGTVVKQITGLTAITNTINVTHLASGMYFLVANCNGKSISQKLLIQNEQ